MTEQNSFVSAHRYEEEEEEEKKSTLSFLEEEKKNPETFHSGIKYDKLIPRWKGPRLNLASTSRAVLNPKLLRR